MRGKNYNDFRPFFEDFRLTTGVVRLGDLSYLVGTKISLVEKNIAHGRIYSFSREEWGADDVHDWAVKSVSVCWSPAERMIAIGDHGTGTAVRVRVNGGGERRDETFPRGSGSPEKRGPLREVRGIARGHAYAVGTCRQVYRREAPDVWTCIDATAQKKSIDMTETCFESIDGFSESDIYAVGWGGEIWHFDGSHWEQIDSGTNLDFHKVVCAEDGYVYACGQSGTLVRGRGSDWLFVGDNSVKQDFWGVEYFQGAVYVATTRFLYKLVETGLELVKFDEVTPSTCYHLSARDGVLWSIGATDVREFNGTRWSEVLSIES